VKTSDFPQIQPATLADWRDWLACNHAQSGSVWLIVYKKATSQFAFSLDQAIEEALCFGWIDSLPRKLDSERTMLLFSPRKSSSLWSAVNKARVQRLLADGRMTSAGLVKIEAAKADGTWDALDVVEALLIPEDLEAAFLRYPGSNSCFEAFPRSVKRGILEWILQAKTAPTRAKRIEETASLAARGERANQWKNRATAR
jgi:uncharacterized protein YdeI (YjbR/CyaY-like superfamily)